jgi:hypothetical protein
VGGSFGFADAPSTAQTKYTGVLQFAGRSKVVGLCQGQPAVGQDSFGWVLSSFAYQRVDNTMQVKARSGQTCGLTATDIKNADSDGLLVKTFFDSSQLGVTDAFSSSGELKVNYLKQPNPFQGPNWRIIGNFVRSGASFDVIDLTGTYVYSWIAGVGENTRTFNVGIQEESGTLKGTAFFGFTAPMTGANDSINDDYSGIIDRMYCNWTGLGSRAPEINPGEERGLLVAAQKQTITFSAVTGLWASSDPKLRYAPTNSCNFTAAMLAYGFKYRESPPYFGVLPTGPSAAFTNELFRGTSKTVTTSAALQSDILSAIGGTTPVL